MPQQLTTYVHTLCTVHRKHDFALTLSQKDNPNLYLKVSEKTPVCKRPYRHGLCWGGKGWFNHVSVSRHSFQKSLPSTLFLFLFLFFTLFPALLSVLLGSPFPYRFLLPPSQFRFLSFVLQSLVSFLYQCFSLSMLFSASQLFLWYLHV